MQQFPKVSVTHEWLEVSGLSLCEFPLKFSPREYVSLLASARNLEEMSRNVPAHAETAEIAFGVDAVLVLEAKAEFPRFLASLARESARYLADPKAAEAVLSQSRLVPSEVSYLWRQQNH